MHCPNCGKKNPDGAKFCSGCGNAMPASVPSADAPQPQATPSAAPQTQRAPQTLASQVPPATSSAGAAAGAGDAIVKLFAKYGKNRVIAVGGGAAAVLVIAIIAIVMVLNAGPDVSEFKSAVETTKVSWASDSTFGSGKAFKVTSVDDVTSTKETLPEPYRKIYGDEVYTLTATVKASNGSIEATGHAEAGYAKSGNSWQMVSQPTVTNITYKATKAIEKDVLVKNANSILSKTNQYSDLSRLYGDIKPTVKSVKLTNDGHGCAVELAYEKSTKFSDAKATVNADFTLDDGVWNVEAATADKNADKVSYDKLIGTWTGKFTEQDAIDNHHCYGAQDKELTLKINSVDSDSLKVEGTYTVLAHKHLGGDSDVNSTDGDTVLQDQPFTMTLEESYYSGLFSDRMDLGGKYVGDETDGFEPGLVIGFGTDKNPDEAKARFHSAYDTHQGLLSSSWYYDSYTLTKAQ